MTIVTDDMTGIGAATVHTRRPAPDGTETRTAAASKLAALLAQGYSRMPMFP